MYRDRLKGAAEAAPKSQSAAQFYLPELLVLRFFAFLSVFAFHTWLFLPRSSLDHPILYRLSFAGAFGVDLFFALSAYLITQLLMRERAQMGRVDVRSFYVRRLLRIWPLYFFFLAAIFLLSVLLCNSRYKLIFYVPRVYFLSFALFVGNFGFMRLGVPSAVVMAHLWSVSIEEQFYLLWPLAVRRADRKGVAWVAIAMLVVASAARLIVSLMGVRGLPIWYNTITRLDPIGIGILLALIPVARFTTLRSSFRLLLIALAVAIWLPTTYYCPVWAPDLTTLRTMIAYPLSALACAALLIATLGTGGGASIASRCLIYLGKISYGLYVFHMVAIVLSGQICLFTSFHVNWNIGVLQAVYILLVLSLTVTMAAASYRFLEAPFLSLKRRFAHVTSRPV